MTECESMSLSDEEIVIEISEVDKSEIKEMMCELIACYMDNNILDYMYTNLKKRLAKEIMPTIYALYSPILDNIRNLQLHDLFAESLLLYFTVFAAPRSWKKYEAIMDKSYVDNQLKRIRAIPQHEQNTPEWFDRRWNLLTASSAWKALGTASAQNALIYSKCKPIDKSKYTNVNINSATHHGHKFEPLSTEFYERMFDTQIEEFGCLPDQYSTMLGASPDGINCKRDNNRYGYLLEIKNPVSRKLTGIPKLEYWVQMQFQMHVTQLHHCDFLETVFKTYETEDEFMADGTFTHTTLGNRKGIIACFHDGTKPIYKYPPWDISNEEYDNWLDTTIDDNPTITWINNTYWRLENYSCVTVVYNKQWFDKALPKFKQIWTTILKERVDGYEHRKAKKREKLPPMSSPLSPAMPDFDIGPPLELPPTKMVLKIRPNSFDGICDLTDNNNN